MTNMDPWDRASNLKPKTTWSMNFKNLINGPRDQIYERAREGSQETNQGDFASMDAFMQRDTIETMNDDQKALEAQHEARARQRGSHFSMRDIPEEINIV